jgi:uncharacterized protein YbjT (DUF2867 family)
MILVTGAGGTVGSEVVKELQQGGAVFRAAFHSQAKADAARAKGIDAVVIDYERPETLDAAFAGIEKLFLLSSSNAEQELAAIDAAKRTGVKHIVKLSVIGAAAESYSFGKIHRRAEKAIEESGIAWTFLRPNGFMDNMHNYMGGSIRGQGAFYGSTGDTKIAHVDVRDIAAVAAKALTGPGHEGKSYTLTGPEGLTYGEIASKLSAASGRTINYVNVGDEDIKAGMTGSGAPEAYADAFVDLQRFYRTGEAGQVSGDVKKVTGRDPIAFDQYAKDHASQFAGS